MAHGEAAAPSQSQGCPAQAQVDVPERFVLGAALALIPTAAGLGMAGYMVYWTISHTPPNAFVWVMDLLFCVGLPLGIAALSGWGAFELFDGDTEGTTHVIMGLVVPLVVAGILAVRTLIKGDDVADDWILYFVGALVVFLVLGGIAVYLVRLSAKN